MFGCMYVTLRPCIRASPPKSVHCASPTTYVILVIFEAFPKPQEEFMTTVPYKSSILFHIAIFFTCILFTPSGNVGSYVLRKSPKNITL